MKKLFKRIHLPALGGLGVLTVGIARLATDHIDLLSQYVSHDTGVAIAAVGGAILAVTKAIHTKGQKDN